MTIPIFNPALQAHPTAPPSEIEGSVRAAIARLETISILTGAGPITEFRQPPERGIHGGWFAHPFLGFKTRIIEATLVLPHDFSIQQRQTALDRFTNACDADIARITVVGGPDLSFTADNRNSYAAPVKNYRDILTLESDPDALLARLGRHTRRNVRRAERIAEELGLKFSFRLLDAAPGLDDEILQVAARNKPIPLSEAKLVVYQRLLATKQTIFESRIETAQGELVSVCRGYLDGMTGYLAYQANDPRIRQINLSLVHRFMLVKALVERQVSRLIFIFGCNGLLHAACDESWAAEVIIIRPGWRGLLLGAAIAALRPQSGLGARLATIWREKIRSFAPGFRPPGTSHPPARRRSA